MVGRGVDCTDPIQLSTITAFSFSFTVCLRHQLRYIRQQLYVPLYSEYTLSAMVSDPQPHGALSSEL
ncbi:hypothetical protein OUZ56_001626 [Daphnia magna]|uniref:Uncharacterized protein n=1 Tax=Daphnia magna TaxID=35525 RepID=A0ABR0A377_9CRUS|nr:hypothetical protein OUZ56_001626 [Daphnia magna]